MNREEAVVNQGIMCDSLGKGNICSSKELKITSENQESQY